MIPNYLDKIRLAIAHKIADALSKTKIKPHHVTLFRFIITVPACTYFFSRGNYIDNIIGLLIYVILAILDWVDGRLARITGKLSALGKWLDETSDRILVVIVLASILLSNAHSQDLMWFKMAIAFFIFFFFLTATNNDFDNMFNVDFNQYYEIEKKVFQLDKRPILADRFLINFLFVHRNPIAQFFFCMSYPLLLGIVTDQLFIAFIFITVMQAIRVLGFLFIMYRVVKKGETNSALTKVLRGYLDNYV